MHIFTSHLMASRPISVYASDTGHGLGELLSDCFTTLDLLYKAGEGGLLHVLDGLGHFILTD